MRKPDWPVLALKWKLDTQSMSLTNIAWIIFWLIIIGYLLHLFFGRRKH